MASIIDVVKKIVQHELKKIRIGELGVVTSIFPHSAEDDNNNYECNVQLKNSRVNNAELELRKVPIATGIIGAAAIPNVGDLVLVSFVHGNINQPIITARLYNDEDRPPICNSNEIIQRLPLANEDNETIKLEMRNIPENNPPREALLEMPDKTRVKISDSQILTQVNQTRIGIRQPAESDGSITIESGKSKVKINQDGDITVESEGQMTLTASGDMTLQASNINMKSDQTLNIEAGTDGSFKIGANGQVEAGGTLNIKGASVNIN